MLINKEMKGGYKIPHSPQKSESCTIFVQDFLFCKLTEEIYWSKAISLSGTK